MNTSPAPKKPACKDWHKADIKAAVEKAGYTLRGLARLHGRASSYFTDALARPIPKAEAIIAALLGVSPKTIWPSRYEADGSPRRGLYRGSYRNGADYMERSLRRSSNGAKVKREARI